MKRNENPFDTPEQVEAARADDPVAELIDRLRDFANAFEEDSKDTKRPDWSRNADAGTAKRERDAADALDLLRTQVRQADERGDDAMRRAHETEAETERLRTIAREAAEAATAHQKEVLRLRAEGAAVRKLARTIYSDGYIDFVIESAIEATKEEKE